MELTNREKWIHRELFTQGVNAVLDPINVSPFSSLVLLHRNRRMDACLSEFSERKRLSTAVSRDYDERQTTDINNNRYHHDNRTEQFLPLISSFTKRSIPMGRNCRLMRGHSARARAIYPFDLRSISTYSIVRELRVWLFRGWSDNCRRWIGLVTMASLDACSFAYIRGT